MQKLDPIKMIDTMLNYSEVVPSTLENARRMLEYREGECNDVEHLIEFMNLNDEQHLMYSKELKNSRMVRRECKNIEELLTPLCELIKKHPAFFSGLKKVRVEVAKIKEKQEKRRYYVRVREDLRPFFEEDLNKTIEYDTGDSEHSESENEVETNVGQVEV